MTRVGYGDLLKVPNARWGKGAGGVPWLLRATFGGGDQSAPLPSPLGAPAVEVGSLNFTDTANAISIVSDDLEIVRAVGGSSSDPAVYSDVFTRLAGRALFLKFDYAARFGMFGWSTNAAGSLSVAAWYGDPPAGSNVLRVMPGNVDRPIVRADGYYNVVLVLRTAGALFFDRTTPSKLLWVSDIDSTANLRFVAAPIVIPADFSISEVGIRDLPTPFNTDYGIASQNVASPVSGTSYTATADAITDLTLTAPNPLADQAGYRYRYTDDDNCWHSYFNDTGAYRLDSVAASVATNRISVAASIAATNVRTMRTISNGSLHDAYTLASTTWTKRGAQINVSHLNTNTAIRPYVTGSWTMSNLRSYPVTDPRYDAELNKT